MDDLIPTDDQCDLLTAKVLDKIAAKASDQYGAMRAVDLNPSITEHHTLRRGVVRAAYMLGSMRQPLTDDAVLKMWRLSNFRGSGGQADWFAEGIRAAERAHGIGARIQLLSATPILKRSVRGHTECFLDPARKGCTHGILPTHRR